jgi:hypothetical protein
MSDARIRVRANRSTGELEVEGPAQQVAEWWEKLWGELGLEDQPRRLPARQAPPPADLDGLLSDHFGEYFTEFRPDISDVDKVLVAGAFVQNKEPERSFTTKAANQLLIDQNIKVTNASENVRRLAQMKRVFVVSDGRFRVSASGFDYLKSLKINS